MNSDTWSQAPDIPGSGRHHPYMFPAGDHVYAGMGHSGNQIYRDWYEFNVNTETWETMSDFPGEHRVAGTQFGHQGKGYVLSGDGSNHSWMPTGEFWEYDPEFDSWTELDPHPGISRWAPGSFVINGAVYFLGGENRQTEIILNDVWTYQLTLPVSPTSLTDIENESTFDIYPNPAAEVVYFKGNFDRNSMILIHNSQGQLVHHSTISGNNPMFETSELTNGVYFISVDSGSTISKQKLIIQR